MSEEMLYEYLVPLEKYLSAGVRLGTRFLGDNYINVFLRCA
jgi:small subunit ribosomal protein S2